MYVFYVFLTFFSKSKKHDFLRFFELLHAFSRTVGVGKGSQKCWDAGAPPPMGRAVATTENTLLLAECITIPNFVALGQTVWS